MSHVPEDIIQKLQSLNLLQDSFITSSSIPNSPGRKLQAMSSRARKLRIRADQRLAHHKRKITELQRPKMILEDRSITPSKPASFYLEQARLRYISKVIPSRPSSVISTSRGKSSFDKKEVLSTPAKLSLEYPNWLASKEGFPHSHEKFKALIQNDLCNIVNSPHTSRSDREKEVLLEWFSNVSFFNFMQKKARAEVCDKLTYTKLTKGQTLTLEDSFYIVFRGKIAGEADRVYISNETIDSDTPGKYVAQEETFIFELSKHHFENIQLGLKKEQKDSNLSFLLKVPYFQKWSQLKVQRLSTIAKEVSFKNGQHIYQIDDYSHTFYIIKSGKVLIQSFTEIQHQNKWPVSAHEWKIHKIDRKYIVTLAELGAFKYFGEKEIIENILRQTKAVAVEPSVCLAVKKQEFFDLFTSKEIERLINKSSVVLYSEKELQKRVVNEIQNRKSQHKAYLEAMKGNPKVSLKWGRRRSTDPRVVSEHKEFIQVKIN